MIGLSDRYIGRQVLGGTLFTVVLLSVVLVATMVSFATANMLVPERGGRLELVALNDPRTLDNNQAVDTIEYNTVAGALFEGLYHFTPFGELVPALADGLPEISEDGLTWRRVVDILARIVKVPNAEADPAWNENPSRMIPVSCSSRATFEAISSRSGLRVIRVVPETIFFGSPIESTSTTQSTWFPWICHGTHGKGTRLSVTTMTFSA